MKKIAVFTLNGYFNYGNRLQNYAAQEVLKSLGFKVETVIVKNKPLPSTTSLTVIRINNIRNMHFKEVVKRILYKFWSMVNKNKSRVLENKRTEIFKKFTVDNIIETKFSISDDYIPDELISNYDYFITGSDQVWNPSFNYGSSIYFLTFAPKCKRIAFSPSFGVSEIPLEHQENYQKWLSEMRNLSAREDAGAKIIKKLTGKDALVLVDPTMMLTKEKWLSVSNKATNLTDKKFLLTYFLGGIPDEYKEKIKKIAKDNNLRIVNLGDIKDFEMYQTGPAEFIGYSNSASLFCTDSFHGVVFSILMETPFIAFERRGIAESMFSRIETLLRKFKLESRKVNNITSDNQVLDVDFSHIPPILEAERNKTLDYLKNALNIKDANPNLDQEVKNEKRRPTIS